MAPWKVLLRYLRTIISTPCSADSATLTSEQTKPNVLPNTKHLASRFSDIPDGLRKMSACVGEQIAMRLEPALLTARMAEAKELGIEPPSQVDISIYAGATGSNRCTVISTSSFMCPVWALCCHSTAGSERLPPA